MYQILSVTRLLNVEEEYVGVRLTPRYAKAIFGAELKGQTPGHSYGQPKNGVVVESTGYCTVWHAMYGGQCLLLWYP